MPEFMIELQGSSSMIATAYLFSKAKLPEWWVADVEVFHDPGWLNLTALERTSLRMNDFLKMAGY